MKILRVGSFPTIEKPGVGLHASELCSINSARTIYLTSKEVSDRPIVEGNFKLFEFGNPIKKRTSEKKLFIQFFFILRRISNLIRFSLYGVWLLFSKRVDIVHIHSPMYIIIALAGFFTNKRVYITFHGTDFHRIKKSRLYKMFGRIFTKVFAISPDMLPILSEIHGNKSVILVKNGIHLDIFKNQNAVRKKQIIAVGEFKIEKGFEYLIEAFSNLKKNIIFKEYVLLIVGDGLLRDGLEDQIRSLDMSNSIYLLGRKNREELIELYNQSDVFVLSSISEGFPKVLLEALSCGCKVVSTDVGAVRSVLPDIKLARPKISEDLEKSLSDCIINKNRPNVDFNKFTWGSVREEYNKEYTRIK